MRLLVTIEQRFKKDAGGEIYANDVFDYRFFCRYLSAFDEVIVLARVTDAKGRFPDSHRADGPQISFIEVPYFVGPVEYLKKRYQVQKVVSQAVQQADAFMLRVPGLMGTLVWQQLKKMNYPYGVEVVGDPWEALATASGRSILKPFLRVDAYQKIKKQCAGATVSAYVTKYTLQKRYPSDGWTTHYSSIELPKEYVLNDKGLIDRLLFAKEPFENRRPFRIAHTGSMDALYKSQDTLIEALMLCRSQGIDVELYLMGDGRYRPIFEQKAKVLQVFDKVCFLGMVPSSQVRQQLDDSDLFVLPSLTEGLPRVLIEAMARGLPCLASRVGGNPELLDEDKLFQARDTNQLARKISECLTDYDVLCITTRENLNKAKEFTKERLTPLRNECYRKLRGITSQHNNSA